MTIVKDMIVQVINDKNAKGEYIYRTCVGTLGKIIEVRQYTTKVNVVLEVITLFNNKGEAIDYTKKPSIERNLEVTATDVAPIDGKNICDVKVGDCCKLLMNKSIFVVKTVDGSNVTLQDYVKGTEHKTHKLCVDKIIPIPDISEHWSVNPSKTKEGMYICSHRKYPFKRKYIPMENFAANHHILFTWFKDSKNKLIKKEKAGQFVKAVQEKTYKSGQLVKKKPFTNVHEKEGWFSEMVAQKYVELMLCRYSHKFEPTTKDHYVGIELECMTKMRHEDLALHLAKYSLHQYIRITSDSSIRSKSGYHAVEMRVLCKESEVQNLLKKIEKVLTMPECDVQVNDSCGTHVHFDMRNRKVDRIYDNLCCMQRIVKDMLPKARRSNSFCHAPRSPFFSEQIDNSDHYDAISLSAYKKHKTIEIRYLEGNYKADVIGNWINFWVELINLPEIDRNYTTVEKFNVDFPDFKSIGFMKSRIEQFK